MAGLFSLINKRSDESKASTHLVSGIKQRTHKQNPATAGFCLCLCLISHPFITLMIVRIILIQKTEFLNQSIYLGQNDVSFAIYSLKQQICFFLRHRLFFSSGNHECILLDKKITHK